MAATTHSDAEIDAAIDALSDPERLRDAQDLVARIAPQLQRVLGEALSSGGWFGSAHDEAVLRSAGQADVDERVAAVKALLAEEARIAMLVGVAVGYELASELPQTTKTKE